MYPHRARVVSSHVVYLGWCCACPLPAGFVRMRESPISLISRCLFFFFSSRRRHTRCLSDWSSDVCSSDLEHEHVSRTRIREAIERNEAGGPFSTACCLPFFIYSQPVVLSRQTLLMTRALRTSAATMFRRSNSFGSLPSRDTNGRRGGWV